MNSNNNTNNLPVSFNYEGKQIRSVKLTAIFGSSLRTSARFSKSQTIGAQYRLLTMMKKGCRKYLLRQMADIRK